MKRFEMNILLVSDYYPPAIGGLANYVDDLAHSLCSRGHKVYVYTTVGPRELTVDRAGVIVEPAKHVAWYFPFLYKQRGEKVVPPIPDPVFMKGLERIIDKFSPDIIHAHGQTMFPLSFLKKKHPKFPMLATLHDFGFTCPKRDLFYTYNRNVCELQKVNNRCLLCARHDVGSLKSVGLVTALRLFDRQLNCLDRLIAISSCVAERAAAKYGGRVELVPDFIRTDELFCSITKNYISEEIDVVFGGALIPQKGICEFLKACDYLRVDFPEIKIAVVGLTRSQYNISVQDNSMLIVENVSRLKALEIYKKAKIVVIPSIFMEAGQNIVALEAMALSKPIVASDLGGLKETIIDGKTGILVPAKNSLAIAEAVKTLLRNPKLSRRIGRAGHVRFKEFYSEDKIMRKIEKIYSDAIEFAEHGAGY